MKVGEGDSFTHLVGYQSLLSALESTSIEDGLDDRDK